MNKILGATIIVLSLATAVNAQEPHQKRTPAERAEMQVNWMRKNLAINDAQAQKSKSVIEKYANKRDSLAQGPRNPAKRAAMEDLMKQRDEEIKPLLNNDQFAKFKAHEAEIRAKMADKAGKMPGRE